MVKKVLLGGGAAILAVLVAFIAYLLLWPVPIDPAAWTPPEARGVGVDNLLSYGTVRCQSCEASEDVSIAEDGTVYLAMRDGRIGRLQSHPPPSAEPEILANTHGRPLGHHLDAARNRLVVCDPKKGLLALDLETHELTTLTTTQGGRPFRFTDDVDVATDGTIYFSDASSKFEQEDYRLEFFEHRPNGRLLAYHNETGETELLIDELYFANGVALAADESFVLVNETSKYRVQKYWLTGPKKGTHEILVDNLPGFPDGISRGTDGEFWIALFTPRNESLDELLPHPFLRKVVLRLPEALQPQPSPHAFVLTIDADGNILGMMQDASPDAFSPVTSVEERNGELYLGSLSAHGFLMVTR